ncbi:MAG: NAD(P)-dependent dehydrogenase (short-subunit alcohol dehydrogenase family) [Candidatus Marinamargulisbacteria bacterium]|jgi:NAD(P)-dependent dehydrogenase (short-subunit alcohol dehydrogenase family)
MDKKVAVVTGANRGIGKEIVRQLAALPNMHVILTSRDEEKGKTAKSNIAGTADNITVAKLDVSEPDSIQSFSAQIQKDFQRIDILINNAGIILGEFDESIFDTSIADMKTVMQTNVYGPMMLCQALTPLMKQNNYGRIVNMSSGMGQLSEMSGNAAAYRVSKTALNALSRILSKELSDTNILVNAMCPGWVRTEMGGENAHRNVQEGAKTAIWLATLDDNGPTGDFFRDNKQIDW